MTRWVKNRKHPLPPSLPRTHTWGGMGATRREVTHKLVGPFGGPAHPPEFHIIPLKPTGPWEQHLLPPDRKQRPALRPRSHTSHILEVTDRPSTQKLGCEGQPSHRPGCAPGWLGQPVEETLRFLSDWSTTNTKK